MLIPYNTDAPLYHAPIATVGMIVANAAMFFGMLWLEVQVGEDSFERIQGALILQYGHGLRPWQWITSNFMHAGILHLLGNMFCLWGFGLVVEGKVGWQRFLLIFFGIGVAQCALEQTMMLVSSQGGSLGASSIIFGLMAICLVWAPRNEMSCVLLLGFRPIAFDVTVYTVVIVSLLIEVGIQLLTGFSLSSQVLHLMGASAGFGLAILMLKKGWVDCENWDVFSVWQGTENRAQEDRDAAAEKLLNAAHAKRAAGANSQPALAGAAGAAKPGFSNRFRTSSQPPAASVAVSHTLDPAAPEPAPDPKLMMIRQALADGMPAVAFDQFQELASDPLYWPLPEPELLKTIVSFHDRKEWLESIPAMQEYLRHFKKRETQVRIKLAQILIDFANRPEDARDVLEPLQSASVSEKDGERIRALGRRAGARNLGAME